MNMPKQKSLHFKNSYKIWSVNTIDMVLVTYCTLRYGTGDYCETLNRTKHGIIIEWWLHNIFYYITLPFIKIPKIKELNDRFKHVDLEERVR